MRQPTRVSIFAALIAFLLVPIASFAQSIVKIPPQQCVYRLGDDPAWAAPGLDETGWRPYPNFQLTGDAVHVWLRCHVQFDASSVSDPAVQVGADGPQRYQVFVDGARLAEFPFYGFSHTTAEKITLPLKGHGVVRLVAIRAKFDRIIAGGLLPGVFTWISMGSRDALVNRNDSTILAQLTRQFLPVALRIIVAVAGSFALGLYLVDRTEISTLWLAVACIPMAEIIDSPLMWQLSYTGYPPWLYELNWLGGEMNLRILGELFFFFAVAGRRMPKIFYAAPLTVLVLDVGTIGAMVLPARLSLPLSIWTQVTSFKWMFSVLALCCLAPFVAFWPYSKLKGEARLTAVLCACWGLLDCVFLAQQVVRGRESWLSSVEDLVSCAVAGVVLWIVVLTLRKHRASTLERATMRGEMAAAGQIQRMLVPERLEVAAGMEVSAAFFPAKHVGGDFYFCRMLAAGTQRILLGDVSGKGVPAALTSALLLGAADRCDHLRPCDVLSEMNQVLRRKAMTGFTTCLCADLAPDGSLTLANAGHLAPYRNGEEMSIESGLPLGITPEAVYPETAVQLAPGDALAFVSDGVVEARNQGGELFGFDRTRDISRQTAEQIAEAARQFGQDDDITVLTLTLAPAGVLT